MILKADLGGAQQNAVSGIKKAHNKAAQAAVDVVSAMLSSQATAVTFSGEARELAAQAEGDNSKPGRPAPVASLTDALVTQTSAKHEQAANIKVLETVHQMQEELNSLR